MSAPDQPTHSASSRELARTAHGIVLLLAIVLAASLSAWLGRVGVAIAGPLFTLVWLIRKSPVTALIIMLLLGGHR